MVTLCRCASGGCPGLTHSGVQCHIVPGDRKADKGQSEWLAGRSFSRRLCQLRCRKQPDLQPVGLSDQQHGFGQCHCACHAIHGASQRDPQLVPAHTSQLVHVHFAGMVRPFPSGQDRHHMSMRAALSKSHEGRALPCRTIDIARAALSEALTGSGQAVWPSGIAERCPALLSLLPSQAGHAA